MQGTWQIVECSSLTPHPLFSALREKASLTAGSRTLIAWETSEALWLVAGAPSESLLPAFIFSSDASLLEVLKAVADYYAPMNLVQQSLWLQISREAKWPQAKRVQEFLPILGYPSRKEFLLDLDFLATAPPELHQWVVDKKCSLKQIRILRNFGHSALVAWWLDEYAPTQNILLTIINSLQEIQLREKTSLVEILSSVSLPAEPGKGIPPATRDSWQKILEQVEKLRYPVLTSLRRKMQQLIQRTELPTSVKVEFDPDFEAPYLTFHLEAQNFKELQKLLKTLNSTKVQQLFKAYQEPAE